MMAISKGSRTILKFAIEFVNVNDKNRKPKHFNEGRNDLRDAAEAIKSGEKTVRQIRNEQPHTFHTYGRTLQELENDRLSQIFRSPYFVIDYCVALAK